MASFVHRLSAFLFYLLGTTFFVAHLLRRNDIYEAFNGWWLRSFDLPLMLVAVLYGGTSLYLSVRSGEKKSTILALVIGIPLFVLLALFIVTNFWEILV